MADAFAVFAAVLGAPARRAAPVAPHDTNALTAVPQAIYVGTGGTIVMRGVDGSTDQTWKNVPSGAILPFRAAYIRVTGTTAADMLALI